MGIRYRGYMVGGWRVYGGYMCICVYEHMGIWGARGAVSARRTVESSSHQVADQSSRVLKRGGEHCAGGAGARRDWIGAVRVSFAVSGASGGAPAADVAVACHSSRAEIHSGSRRYTQPAPPSAHAYQTPIRARARAAHSQGLGCVARSSPRGWCPSIARSR